MAIYITICQVNMKTEHPDILVIGLGAMGAAITYQLAKCRVNVVGVDQFTPPHAQGSTHGETRITREAIGEGMQFVPLAMRSHQLWRKMESETGRTLFTACGGVVIARVGGVSRLHEQQDFLGNTFRAAEAYAIPHERLSASEITARFPQFVLRGDECGYFEPGAGYLLPEACVSAQLTLASQHGADLRVGETVRSVLRVNDKTIVETDRARYQAGVTIVAAGAWIPQLLPALATTLTVRRQVQYWFARDVSLSHRYRPRDFPVFIWHWGDGADDVFYGFPQIDDSNAIKVACEQNDTATTPQTMQRDVLQTEIDAMFARHVNRKLRGIDARCVRAVPCLYTNAPAANFIIDRLPEAHDTIVVSACSGHGFKHSAAIGEAVALMAVSGETPKVLQPFALHAQHL